MLTTLLSYVALTAAGTTLEAGPLVLELHVAETAQLFHIVDQLSNWSPYCHQQYRRALARLSEKDEALLSEHARLRKNRQYGALDQAFYTDLTFDRALEAVARHGTLSPAEVDTERRVLTHFSARIRTLIESDAAVLSRAVTEVEKRKSDLTAFAERASRFVLGGKAWVPFFLIVSPAEAEGGGGFNGGVLTVEVPRNGRLFNVLVHECWHAFVRTQQPALEAAARSTPGLDETTLGEGLAYAVNPGLFRDGTSEPDPLLERVKTDLMNKRSFSDPYVRFNRFGLALRPLLGAALDDPNQTLLTFLPRACDVFLATRELSRARGPDR